MSGYLQYVTSIRRPFGAKRLREENGVCTACGSEASFKFVDVITDELKDEWGISKYLQRCYSYRESMYCSVCNCSGRLRALALAISYVYGEGATPLSNLIKDGRFDKLNVAEINACGDMHAILTKIKGLNYSEYAPRNKSIRHEDLQALSYKNESLDLVLTSDTLEHVPDYMLALKEIYRVLKPGGHHIFTIPLLFSRKTRRRIALKGGEVVETMKGSYHGSGEPDNLVASEFGIDFLDDLRSIGFSTTIYFANPVDMNEVNFVLVTRKADT